MGVRLRAGVAVAAQMVLLAFSGSASASSVCPADQTQPTNATAYDAAMAVVCDINYLRADKGLRPLRWDWRLWSSAQKLAEDMAGHRYASHVTPEGQGLADRLGPTGYIPNGSSWLAGENLGWGTSYLATPLAIVLGWLDSPKHRENLLDPEFRDIGVGMVQGAVSENGDVGVIYVANFGMRATPVDTLRIRGRAGRSRRR